MENTYHHEEADESLRLVILVAEPLQRTCTNFECDVCITDFSHALLVLHASDARRGYLLITADAPGVLWTKKTIESDAIS